MVKSGDFKTSKSGVVNTNVKKEAKKPDDLPENHDVKDIKELLGGNHFNVGEIDDAPDKDDPFGFFGVRFGEFQVGVELADVHVVSPPQETQVRRN